ncbi:MAG: dienelactone hydrolase family protein [Trichocoleus desertorum ATA4-8-CV12]|jgi:carboxymethylenebutenolidase|nr:dienelactone hydrolase family protein [Trichocoleus desertorum ATA4-8-CV12]
MKQDIGSSFERQALKDAAGDTFHVSVLRRTEGWSEHAVVLLPAIAGVNPYIEEVALQLSNEGYDVVVMDYFSRVGTPPDLSTHEKIGEAVQALDDRRVLQEVDVVIGWLAMAGIDRSHVGVLGFCIGGTYAVLSCESSNTPGCAVAYYGQLAYSKKTTQKPRDPVDAAEHLRAPVLGHFGTKDRLIGAPEINDFSERLWATGLAHEVHTYAGAPHAFDEWFRPMVFRPVASAEAWERTRIFLDWHLRQRTVRRALSYLSSSTLETNHVQKS